MKNIFKFLIMFFLLNSFNIKSQILKNITSSFQSNSAYYLDDSRTGDFIFDKRFRSNNYLNLKTYTDNNWNFELQIESYLPKALLNYSSNFEEVGISTFNVQYNKKKLNIQLGNFYEQFGSGMILRTWEDKNLGINNSIRGLNIKYRINDQINLTTLFGDQKKGFKYSKGYIIGFDSEFDVSELLKKESTFLLGLSYVGRNDQKTKSIFYKKMSTLFSLRIDYSATYFYSNFEAVNKSTDPVIMFGSVSDTFMKKGSALLFNSGFFKNGLGFDFTFRRLENMSLFSEKESSGNPYNESIVNYLPGLTKQHDYSLTNLYVYAAQPSVSFQSPNITKAGEIGIQTDLYYSIEKETFFGGKHGTNLAINWSLWNNLDGDFDFNNQKYETNLFGFGDKYFTELSFEIRKKWSEKFHNTFLYVNQFYSKKFIVDSTGKVDSNILVLENIFKINNKSLRLEIQHLTTQDDTKNWSAIGLEYNLSSAVSLYISDLYNYQNPDIDEKIHYYNLGGSYSKGINRFTINYGRQRGGLVCTGGICRYVPESTGFSFTVNTSLF